MKQRVCETCPTPRSVRPQQSEFGSVEIISATAADEVVTTEVEVQALPFGTATGTLQAVAEQDGTEIGSVTDEIQQSRELTQYEISFPFSPLDGFNQALVTVDLIDDGQTVDSATTQVAVDPGAGSQACVELTVVEDTNGGRPPNGDEGLSGTALAVGAIGLGAVAAALRGGE